MQYTIINNSIIELENTDVSTSGKRFKSRFLQPGLAGYPGQYGNALIRKENLDKFINTLVNKPVIINHKSDITEKDKAGEVLNVWFNADDGWYWCSGIIYDNDEGKKAQNLIKNRGWSVSCSYSYTKSAQGGTENNIPYDIEFLDGEFEHLAIVENPRYERANIVFNAKIGNKIPDVKENDMEVNNGGAGSGDFGHAGRPGKVGGSEPAGTGRQGKYDEKYQSAKKEGYQGTWEDFKKADIEAELQKDKKVLKKVTDFEKPKDVNKKEGNGIEIKKETAKAYLLSKDGVNFWVQKRWYKDGKLTPAGEKSYQEAIEQKRINEENKNKFIKFKHSWESEKAYGIDINFDAYDLEKDFTVRIFVPKSQVKDGAVPYWLYQAKMKEAYEQMGYKAPGGFTHYDNSGFVVENSENTRPIYTIIDGELYEIIDDMGVKQQQQQKTEKKANNSIQKIINNAIAQAIAKSALGEL